MKNKDFIFFMVGYATASIIAIIMICNMNVNEAESKKPIKPIIKIEILNDNGVVKSDTTYIYKTK